MQRDLLWAMTFSLSSSSLFQSHWDCWTGSGGVLSMGAGYIPAHPAPLPMPLRGEPRMQLKHFQRKILCALPPPHLCHEQGARCRCLGIPATGHGSAHGVASIWGLGCSPPPLALGIIMALHVCCRMPELINHLYLKINTCR